MNIDGLEIFKILLIVTCLVGISIIGNTVTKKSLINVTCPACPNLECNYKEPDCISECPNCPECPELPLFMREAKNVADAHYYEKDRYVCQDFAEELFKRLKADGYEVRYCIGIAKWCLKNKREKDCWHAWVKLGNNLVIEATNGELIEPKDYKLDYDERRCLSGLPNKH